MAVRTHLLISYVCFITLVFLPFLLHATGIDADKQCTPFYSECQCMMKPNPDKRPGQPKCIKGENKHSCICTDKTNKLTTIGTCVADNVCKGTSASNLDGKQTSLIDPKNTPWGAYSGAGTGNNLGEFGQFGNGGEFTSRGFDGADTDGNPALDADPGEPWEPPQQTDPSQQHVNTDPNSAENKLGLLSSEPLSGQKSDLIGGNATANDVFSQTPVSGQIGQLSGGFIGGDQGDVGSGETVNASEHTFGDAEGNAEAKSSCSGWLCSASETMSKYDPFSNQAASQETANQEPLRAESNGKVDPIKLYNAAYNAFDGALEKNGGSWPKATIDAFRKMGVDDPTDPDQLAEAAVKLAKAESNLDAKVVSAYDAARGKDSRGLFQFNNQGGDARYGIERGDAVDPQKSVEGLVKVAEQGLLGKYFGPIMRGGSEVLANNGWYEANVAPRIESQSVWNNISTASYTTSSELTNNLGMYNTGFGASEYASLGDPSQPTSRFDGADTWPSSSHPISSEVAYSQTPGMEISAEPGYASPATPAPGINIPTESGYTSSPTPTLGIDLPTELGYASPLTPAPGLDIPAEPGYTSPAIQPPGIDIQTETHNSNFGVMNLGTETHNSNLDIFNLGTETYNSNLGVLNLGTEPGLTQSLGIVDPIGQIPTPVVELATGEQITAQIAAEAMQQNVIPSGASLSDLAPNVRYSLGAEGDSLVRDAGGDITYTDRNGTETYIAGNTVGSMTASEFEQQILQGQVPTMSEADIAARIPTPDTAQLDELFTKESGEKITADIAYQDAMERFKDDGGTPVEQQSQFSKWLETRTGQIKNLFSDGIGEWTRSRFGWVGNIISESAPWPNTSGNVLVSGLPTTSDTPTTPPAETSPEAQPSAAQPAVTPPAQGESVPLPEQRPAAPPASAPPASAPPAPAAPRPDTSTPKPDTTTQSPSPTGNIQSGNSGFSSILGSLSQMLGQMLGKLLGNNQQQQGIQTAQQATTTTATTTPTPTIPAVASLLADPSRTTTGNSVRLVWASIGTVGCSIKDGAGTQISSGSSDGFVRTETLATSTTFTLACVTTVGGSVSASTTVIVSPSATTTTATTTAQ